MIRKLLCSLMYILCMMILGCLRPNEKQTYVVVEPGDPIQALDTQDGKAQKVIVTGTTMKGGNIAKQDVTGWIMMPPSHWKVISTQLERDKANGTLNK